jgi:hypothetical protein
VPSTTDARACARPLAAVRRAAVPASTLLVAALSAAGAAGVAAQQPTAAAARSRPDDAEIARAIAAVKADPNLATERTITMLRLNDRPAQGQARSPWLDWIAGLVRWFEQSARVLVWGAAAVAAGLLVRYIVRTIRAWDPQLEAADAFVAPTHVQDLDIRPETLPEDIGAAARRLWDRGEHRAALALLYRGLLSRLVHVHAVPIRDSSTEGDCLALAALHLTTGGHDYTARLVSIWQRAVYGHERADTSIVHGLCDDFASALDAGPRESPA